MHAAALAADPEALRRLYAESRRLFGDQAGVKWASAMSDLDASAQTG